MILIAIMLSMLTWLWMKTYTRKVQLTCYLKHLVQFSGCLDKGEKRFQMRVSFLKCPFNLSKLQLFKLFINLINLESIRIINNLEASSLLECHLLCLFWIKLHLHRIQLNHFKTWMIKEMYHGLQSMECYKKRDL
jgi:hypothetical protein